MYLIESHRKIRLSILVLVAILGASVGTPPDVLYAEPADFSSNATPIEVGTTVRGQGYVAGEPDCFRAEVPGAGLVRLEVVVPAGAEVEPRLGLLSPAPGELRTIARSAGYVVARSRSARSIEICVGAQDPARRLGEYRLETRWVGLGPVDSSEEEQLIELEPEGLGERLPAYLDRSEEEQLIELEPEGLGVALDPGPDFSEEEQLIELEPEGLGVALDPDPDFSEEEQLIELEPEGARTMPLARLCGTAADDHGDTLLCSTPLALGRTVHGEIANDWGDDYDVFAIAVTAARTVRIRTTGTLDATGGLYDRYGQLLAADEGRGIRLVKTLSPGLYFVRIEGHRRAEGDYTLTVDSLAHSW